MRRATKALRTTTLLLAVLSCDSAGTLQPETRLREAGRADVDDALSLVAEVRMLSEGRGIGPLIPTARVRTPLVLLGQALAFDPILSGNRNISCMTCHVPSHGTADGKSLSVGEGGSGLGPIRSHPQGILIPRNAPPLFNLEQMRNLFWDGRIEVDDQGTLHTPAGSHITDAMRRVFEFGPISALGMFPVTNRLEMRGFGGNELAAVADDDFTTIWKKLMERLGAVGEYRALFRAAYPDTRFEDVTFAHASNAIAGFIVDEFASRNTPWDRFLAGNDKALTQKQLEGAKTFMQLKCSICHGGPTFSDQQFHNVAVAQVGPGQGDGFLRRDDFGRMRVSGQPSQIYQFRTTPLRNVELTAPYGHDGAILGLREFIEHYSESHLKLMAFDDSPLEHLLRGSTVPNATEILLNRDPLLEGVVLTPELVDKLMDYMSALTDDGARALGKTVPKRVPSGLPVLKP